MAPPQPVSARVWAQAIHAVTVQKMSLRRAAQLYGMHHMALYRRVRGQCMTSSSLQVPDDFQLTRAQEQAILEWLRQQYSHEQAVSSDEMRNVVRTVVSENERVVIPADFPSNRWIASFKRTHGLMRSSPLRPSQQAQANANHAPASGSNQSTTSNQTDAVDTDTQAYEQDGYSDQEGDRMQTQAAPRYPWRETTNVPPEVWEQAMEAVERHGMSLRNAAKAYGVHFAALYRRLKKKDESTEAPAEPMPAPEFADYLPLDDESAIIRVIHARAELGVLMTYDELVDLLHRTAMKYVHAVTTDLSNSLVTHFRNRVDASVSDLVEGWPLPRLAELSSRHFQRAQEQQEHKNTSPSFASAVYFV